MKIDTGTELHDYVVLAGQDDNTYVRDYQGSLWKVNVDANGQVTVDTTAGIKGKVYNSNGTNKTSLAKTTVNNKEVDITPDSVLKKAHEAPTAMTSKVIKMTTPSATPPNLRRLRTARTTHRQSIRHATPLARQRRLWATMPRPLASAPQPPASRQLLSAARQPHLVTMPPPSAKAV